MACMPAGGGSVAAISSATLRVLFALELEQAKRYRSSVDSGCDVEKEPCSFGFARHVARVAHNWRSGFGFGCGCCGGSRGVLGRGRGCLSGVGRLGIWSVVDGWADLADVDGSVDIQILQT
jgi:hypothetical protein